MPTFIYRIIAPRANFLATISPEEMALMGLHFGYLQELERQGKVVFVGRAANGDFGIVVFQALDLVEASAIANADPAVNAGMVQVEVHEFLVVPMGSTHHV